MNAKNKKTKDCLQQGEEKEGKKKTGYNLKKKKKITSVFSSETSSCLDSLSRTTSFLVFGLFLRTKNIYIREKWIEGNLGSYLPKT